MTKTCIICGKEFEIKKGYPSKRDICYDDHYIKCSVCGKEFVPYKNNKTILLRYKNGGSVTCSRSCQYKLQNKSFTRNCIICGKEFNTNSLARKICYNDHYMKCSICGKNFVVNNATLFNIYKNEDIINCSNKDCINIAKKLRSIKKYGVDNPLKSEVIRDKIKQTNIEKYGAENIFQSNIIKDKIKNTNIEKYGNKCCLCNEDIKAKTRETNIKRYGVPYYCMTEDCKYSNGKKISQLNIRFSDLLKYNNIDNSLEYIIDNYSYDIIINNTNILIELDPSISHNIEKSFPYIIGQTNINNPPKPDYQLNKTIIASNNGYRCIHIFDWDNREKIINLVNQNKEKLYARKCHIKNVLKSDLDKFLEDNHLQGTCRGQTIKLGLYYDDKLVQVMTFGKPRYNKNYQYELLRLCTDNNYIVIGGSEKLFKYFIKNYNPESIISYCDISKFSGDVYTRIGFNYLYTTDPRCHWSKGSNHITDNLLRQRGYDQLFGTNYGKGTDNKELMLNSGWLPVYDCGQSVYEWHDYYSKLAKS